ncbi:MAG: hypothetical protein KKH21_01615 [Gammaproteobacteria bacterium]|jgi:pyruvate/2-oxoglutarate dehydrogenase complex dihydrolipoamide acyltransferase (E2) component|nr:hypothetical protein [Gammaproteobacteria bacterium]MBU0827836.1 hypothetical protein [Gammaproteobacteria bacterium]MBU0889580.1 hypothetical protein [Gammaproteobacteria bacterium]MBU1816461.1 hypothetical protein [Gammaproteobacteria bacterium]
MADASIDHRHTIYAKTAAGQHEIQSRALGLSPLVRRLLLLVDGQRSGKDLEVFVAGHDVVAMFDELLAQGCIEAKATARPAAAPAAAAAKPAAPSASDDLGALPPADSRTAKELEMARNFMTNTVNNTFGHHNRISLIESIHACSTSEQLRGVYPHWVETMSSSAIGLKRLPELREKLFAVL